MPSLESLFPNGARLLQRLTGRPRQLAAGACGVLAVLTALSGNGGATAEPTESVVVAAHDLPAGALLDVEDVRIVSWPRSAIPDAAVRMVDAAVGRQLGAAMGAGEPITALRLGDGGYGGALRAGAVAVIVDVGAQAALVQAGDRVNLYASLANEFGDASATSARLVVTGAGVLAALPSAAQRGDAGRVVLEIEQSAAPALASVRGMTLTLAVIKPP